MLKVMMMKGLKRWMDSWTRSRSINTIPTPPNPTTKTIKIRPRKQKKRLVCKHDNQFIVGPFWPMLLFVTYPLIFGVSVLTLRTDLPGKLLYIQIGWALVTCQLIRSLFNMGFHDPVEIEPPSWLSITITVFAEEV